MNFDIKFETFTKIPRLSRDIVVTEKLDGTNGQIYIGNNGEFLLGSRNRWLNYNGSKASDNMGFAKWATENKEELLKLGVGRHYGEWVGTGIQDGYGMTEKRFALFNTGIWNNENKPKCCDVVPVLYQGIFDTNKIDEVMNSLKENGSVYNKGFMNPEGIIIYHVVSKQYFKKTFNYDSGKWNNFKEIK